MYIFLLVEVLKYKSMIQKIQNDKILNNILYPQYYIQSFTFLELYEY